ncbi:MAG: winged helix-turn-helix domain-containing protein [Methanotrichaceae archaeon]|jgi:predicted transcriptional regulator
MKRDKLEIARNILLICKNGAKKTEIVYKVNLNFKNAEGLSKVAHRSRNDTERRKDLQNDT